MIRVLVVEDEKPILNSIKLAIEMTDPRFVVVATAYNGEEALSALQTVEVDVVFTDIRMPVLDGIGLITRLRETYSASAIVPVIISGYQEFEYAKQALSMNVFDYLLKPLSLAELRSLLLRIAAQVEGQRQASVDKYMEELLGSDGHPKGARPAALPERGVYGLLHLCACAFPSFAMEDSSPAAESWARFDLTETCRVIAGEGPFWVLDGKTDSEKLIVSLGTEARYDETTRAFAEALLDRWRQVIGTPITIGMSGPLALDDIRTTAQMMRARLNRTVSIGESRIFSLSQSTDLVFEVPKLNSFVEKKLLFALNQRSYEQFLDILRELVDEWRRLKPRQYEVEKLVHRIAALCLGVLDARSRYYTAYFEADLNQAVLQAKNYDELLVNLSLVYKMAFAMKGPQDDDNDRSKQLMERLDEYLRANLTEPINHQTLSEKFGLVPSYLSKLFTSYKGMSPAKYLLSLRMKRAKELLEARPRLLMKDIAALIGYQDPLYFSKLFKKETGIWPSEYEAGQNRTSV
ncbi:response regulator transcription factor [Cohnella rhizosphaerae]|uniref:Response regulator n=1 Tax=Cohnella rhizosphaerae TaxID=1457232 RepID=A0A9X4QU72_9BACL|nr:response regulator [Cohnella rhizosphaerae]MDG0811123.1 response regulator [Cohnella rhizosphaerae]